MTKDELIERSEAEKTHGNYNEICWEAAVNIVCNRAKRANAYSAEVKKYYKRLDAEKETINCDGTVEYLTDELCSADYSEENKLQIQKVKDAIYKENEKDIDDFSL